LKLVIIDWNRNVAESTKGGRKLATEHCQKIEMVVMRIFNNVTRLFTARTKGNEVPTYVKNFKADNTVGSLMYTVGGG
jgi:hypothetical protein